MVSSRLDPETLAGLRDLGPDEFRELVQLYLNEAAARVSGLQTMVERGDSQSLSRLAHSLMGSSLGFGANTLAGYCSEIEQATARGAPDVEELVAEVTAEFDRVRAALKDELQ